MPKTAPTSQEPTSISLDEVIQPADDATIAALTAVGRQTRDVALMDGSGLGDANPIDLAIRLKIVYDVSKDKPDTVPAGSFALGQNYRFVFADGGRPMPLVGFVVGTSVIYFKEWNDYSAGGPIPKTYLSRDAALKDGQRPDWGVKGSTTEKPTVAPAIDIYMLVEKPAYHQNAHKADDADAMFSWYIDGKPYALTVYTADRGAFKSASTALTEIRNQDALMRRVPLAHGSLTTWQLEFSVASRKSANGRNQKYCVIKTATVGGERVKATDAFTNDLKEILKSFASPVTTTAGLED